MRASLAASLANRRKDCALGDGDPISSGVVQAAREGGYGIVVPSGGQSVPFNTYYYYLKIWAVRCAFTGKNVEASKKCLVCVTVHIFHCRSLYLVTF